jgi:ElaB/YqjD/DUF883 family membrane-anchored ribosome-binding protein
MATATRTERTVEPCGWPTREAIDENLREVRRAVTTARHAAEDAVAETALKVRRHPLRAVAGAVAVGTVAGALIGFGAGWLIRARD